MRATLPVVGAAVAGVGGGAAMLLLNSITEKTAAEQLKTSGGLRYRVNGIVGSTRNRRIKTAIQKDGC